MKPFIGIVFLLLFLGACGKKYGDMRYKAKFTTQGEDIYSKKSGTLYSGFGTYITSITPYHFSCKMSMLMFQDNLNEDCHMISYVDGHDNQPGYEIASYADFSANKEVEFTPILYSKDMRDGVFEQKEVDFRFLTFIPIYFEHEFEIPIQYLSLVQSGNSIFTRDGATYNYDSNQNKITVHTKGNFSYGAIHGNANAMPTGFTLVFGNTDSSYIYSYKGIDLPEDKRFPFWYQENGVIIRSDKYTPLKVIMPDEGQTNIMYSTVSFNTDNLIQVYAGNDQIPYTLDDVFVYAPQFWDRMHVKLETIQN